VLDLAVYSAFESTLNSTIVSYRIVSYQDEDIIRDPRSPPRWYNQWQGFKVKAFYFMIYFRGLSLSTVSVLNHFRALKRDQLRVAIQWS